MKRNSTVLIKPIFSIWGAKKCASWIAEDMKNVDCGPAILYKRCNLDLAPENFAMAHIKCY
jgi:hypothetical protein